MSESSTPTLEEMANAEAANEASADESSTDTSTIDGGEQDSAADAAQEQAADATKDDHLAIAKLIDQTQGTSFAKKYTSDDDLFAGLASLYKRIGERDADAEFGRQLRQNESDFRAYLDSQGQQQPIPKPNGDVPKWDPLWMQQITTDRDTGELVPAKGAPPDVVSRYQRYQAHFQERLRQLVDDPNGFLGEVLQQKIAEAEQRVAKAASQQVTMTQEQQAIQSWIAEHGDKLIVDNNPELPTALGKKFREIYEELDGIPEGRRRLDIALRYAKAQMPRPNPTKSPAARAGRQPAVSPSLKTGKTPEELIREGMSLTEIGDLLASQNE